MKGEKFMSKFNINKLTNSTDDQDLLRPATLWGLPFVAEVLPIFEANYPDDSRLRQSLEVATKYVQGEKRGQGLRRVSMAVFKIGKEVDEPAKYVTKAASAISAVPYTHTDLQNGEQGWRQARHVLGPIVYAAYALELSKTSKVASDDMIDRAIKEAPTEVHTIIRNFPPQPNQNKRLDILFKKLDDGLRARVI
jgi:hypothetical protein